jgi:hypothetical protein
MTFPGYRNYVPFEAAWRRVDRAAAHRHAAAQVWNEWIEDDPYSFSIYHYGEGRYGLFVTEDDPTPPEMAVLLGEWLYNLRCALDYAVYEAAVCVSGQNPPPQKGQLQLPVCFTEADYRKNEYRLKPLADQHRIIIEKMQPYRHDDPDTSALGWLHKLARIDRHRSLHLITTYAAEMNPLIEIAGAPVNLVVEFDVGERVVVDRQAEIAQFTVTPWNDDWEVSVNPQTGLDPEIADWTGGAFWRRVEYNDRLTILETLSTTIIAPLEYDCLGRGREAKFLTDDFRVECDARREERKRTVTW